MKTAMILGAVALLLLSACEEKTVRFTFDPDKEVSGTKFALNDIHPGLPTDWDDYNYVAVEYKISTPQRLYLGFTSDAGYNDLRVMSYVPNAWNRIVIPLKYFTDLPDPAHDMAATFNHARYTGWINLEGGKRGPLHGVDSIGVRLRRAIGTPSIEIRDITLYVEDPGDAYLETEPAFDEFGQANLTEWPGKVHSLEELRAAWQAEEDTVVPADRYQYSTYGGYKQKRVHGTGYFRTEKIDGRWWLVDPEGYLFLSVGVDCVKYGGGGDVRDYENRPSMYKEVPAGEVLEKIGSLSMARWNLYRRYGDNFQEKAADRVVRRMDAWGLNTIANWSSQEIIGLNRKAFLLSLRNLGMENELMGLCDVYRPDYLSTLKESIQATVAGNLGNPWLIGYFIANEPAWIGQESRLCQLILDGPDKPVKTALQAFLKEHPDTDESRRTFIFNCFDRFLTDVGRIFRQADPNHLNLGIRFGKPDDVDETLLRICAKRFDVFSFNCYEEAPGKEMLDQAMAVMDLPMLIGEFHFGTVDRGLAQALWQVESQAQRGVAYRYYVEQAYSHPAIVGTGYFQWSDQDMSGRFDGENFNCGLVDVTDRPYPEMTAAMSASAEVLFEVHSGIRPPFSERAENPRGFGGIPDLWNE